MIILSNNSKEKIVRANLEKSNRAYNSKIGKITLDFGNHMIFDDFDQALHSIVFSNITVDFSPEVIIDDLDCFADNIYVYEIKEENLSVREISMNELLLSGNDDEFAMGCLLSCRKVYNDKDTTLEEELNIKGLSIKNLNKEALVDLILLRDTTGQASLIGDILLSSYNDERLYKNTLKLDATGSLSYVFIQQAGNKIDTVVDKILAVDTEGDLVIDLLNWVDDNPLLLATKIVSINNPFKIIDFINRYDEYLYNVRDCKADTDFVKDEEVVKDYLYTALVDFNYDSMNIEDLLNDDVYYETPLKTAIFTITDSMLAKGRLDLAKNFFELIKNHFNDDFTEKYDKVIYKEDITDIQNYDLDNCVFILISIGKKLFIAQKNRSEFLKFSQDLMLSTEDYIELNKLT